MMSSVENLLNRSYARFAPTSITTTATRCNRPNYTPGRIIPGYIMA